MKEVEVKILDIDREEVEKKLRSMGAEQVFDGELNAVFLDDGEGSLRKENKTLRLRKEGEVTKLTFKKPVDNPHEAKVKEETESVVEDFEKTEEILKHLDLEVWRSVRKWRTSFKLGNVRYEFDKHLDNFSWIPEFLEIEGPDEDTVFAAAEELGFTKEDCHACSVDYLHKYYGRTPDT